MPTNDVILNGLVAYLKGETEHMTHEDVYVSDALVDGDSIVVTFDSFDHRRTTFCARFVLTQVERLTAPA